MAELYVADVGNSRIKWGRCNAHQVLESVSLPLDDPKAWSDQAGRWNCSARSSWVLAAVNPPRLDQLAAWLRGRFTNIATLNRLDQLPLRVDVDQPERVGIDRLLNALAAAATLKEHQSAIIADAGSAVTVDWVEAPAVFHGGAIFPGLRLMSQALHQNTAQLPLVLVREASPPLPGRSTEQAIAAGIAAAVVGGIRLLSQRLGVETRECTVFLTGGDGPLLAPGLASLPVRLWPHMTLEGLRQAAARLLP